MGLIIYNTSKNIQKGKNNYEYYRNKRKNTY